MRNKRARVVRGVLPPLTAACVVAALSLCWRGSLPPDYRWSSAQSSTLSSTRAFEIVPNGWEDIQLSCVFPQSGTFDVCDREVSGQPVIAMGDYSRGTYPERSISSWVVSGASQETVAYWLDRWLVSSVPARDGVSGDLLLWFPETWYAEAGPELRADTIALFRHNYAMSCKLFDLAALQSSVIAAGRGQMASMYSRLLLVDLLGEELHRFPFDPRYTADAGFVFDTDFGPVALIETDGGYSNSDLFYLLLDQPALSDGTSVAVTDNDDIEGSFRGFFAAGLRDQSALWYRRLGLSSVAYHAVDLDRDGVDELLIETYSAENGVSGGGTSDAGTGYLFCLDQGGNILWRKRVLGVHTGVQCAVADVTGDERLEIMMVWSSGVYEHAGGAAVLASDGTTLHQRTDLGGLYALAAADFDGDGSIELATSGPESRLLLLNGALEVERAVTDTVDMNSWRHDPVGRVAPAPYYGSGIIWRSRVIPAGATDLDGDGTEDLIALKTAWHRWDVPGVRTVWCGRVDLIVYDGTLKEIMREPIVNEMSPYGTLPSDHPASMKLRTFPLDLDGDGADELVIASRGQSIFAFEEAP